RRLVALEWQQKDVREQGPASPAATMTVKITVTRREVDSPKELGKTALASVPRGFEPPAAMTYLQYSDPKGLYELIHSRDWQWGGQTDKHFVLRLIDRGDFVAQTTISPWDAAKPGKHMTPEDFQKQMEATPGWAVEQVLQTGEVPTDGGRWLYRV